MVRLWMLHTNHKFSINQSAKPKSSGSPIVIACLLTIKDFYLFFLFNYKVMHIGYEFGTERILEMILSYELLLQLIELP